MLSDLPRATNDRVLIDYRTSDDAGVYALNGTLLVQTVDFFTPIVDDPYVYGQIAAANAVSDVYAMGGTPLTALAIAAFPKSGLEPGTVAAIFRGGLDKLSEAGVALLGGHTVQDQEIKFGYAITGTVEPGRVWSNAGARIGDLLVLTKPLGTGIVATAIKFDRAPETTRVPALAGMAALNGPAALLLRQLPPGAVGGCTDVTGFGLVGHACEMAAASHVTLAISQDRLPLLPGVAGLALTNQPGGTRTNRDYFTPWVSGRALDAATEAVLYDPQTSGGLLVSLAPAVAGAFVQDLAARSIQAALIGRVEAGGADAPRVRLE